MSGNIPPLDNSRKLVVVGAGPVGCLAAIAFAKMNWQVEIYEARPGKVGQAQSWSRRCLDYLYRFTAIIFESSCSTAIYQPRHFITWHRRSTSC
jgi:2-polyprenyl-6-methoxyphenol hydroxylase-like FAD-dependent oxidoreductase